MNETTKDTLRPANWNEYIGQTTMKATLLKDIQATLMADHNRPQGAPPVMLPHMLLAAPPGVGKTSLCGLIASLTGDPITIEIMPKAKNFFVDKILFDQEFKGGILVLDEIHRMPKSQQEDLLSILEFGVISTPTGNYDIPGCITIIGATTRVDLLDPALVERFPLRPYFESYSTEDMAQIIQQMASKMKDCEINLDLNQCRQLAKGAGTVPRNARKLVLAARSVKLTNGKLSVKNIMKQAGLDEDGLDGNHIKYLEALFRFKGNAGLERLANILFLNPAAVKEMERQMYEGGFIDFTDKGRALTTKGRQKVNESQNRGSQRQPRS